MANRKKLSWESRERIEQKIIALGGDEALSKKATKLVLSPYESKIQKNGLSFQDLKELINQQIIDEKSLLKVSNSTICQNCRQQKRRISYAEVEKLIDDEHIVGKGISAATCKQFRLGNNIDAKAFKILCATLEENCKDVCYQEQLNTEISTEAEQLNIALCKFNYLSERMSFSKVKNKVSYHSLHLQKLTDNYYSCHWLLKSLIINQNQRCAHRIIPLNILKISPNSINSIGDKLLQQIRENLRNFKSSQLKFKITKNSTMNEVAEVLQKILQKQNIIFLVQSLDDIGVPTGEKVIQQFWHPITNNLEPTDHHLFLCFVSVNKPDENQSRRYDHLFQVGNCFNNRDLNNWLQQLEHNQLFQTITTPEDIELEANKIWNKCQGHNDRLLEEIHLSCGCQIEEYLWKKI